MTASLPARLGFDARWLDGGPPSGRNYVRHVLAALAGRPDRERFVAFVPPRPRGAEPLGIAGRRIPRLPAILYNGLAIPTRTPADVGAVAYQHFTPVRSRAGVLTVVHDLIYLTSPERFTAAERAYLGLIPRFLPFADAIATVSEHVRGLVLERWPGRDPASVLVAPNGVDDRLLAAAGLIPAPTVAAPSDPAPVASPAGPDAAGASRPIRPGRPYVLYLGRLNSRKNLPGLIRAFARADLVDHDLVLAGRPSGVVEDLVAIGAEAGLGDRLRLPGHVPDEAVADLYRGSDAFAYVSFDEGFGVPPLEAMAFGRPVVCSDIPALRETAEPGGAALVQPADVEAIAAALDRSVHDAAVREAAARCGPPQALRYRWSATADALVAGLDAVRR